MWSSLNHKQSPHGGCVPLVSNPGLIPFIFFLSLLSGGFFGVDAFELIRSKGVVGNYNPTEGNSIFMELFRRKEMRTESMEEILQSHETVILIVDFQWDFMRDGQIEHKHADTTSYVGLVEGFVKLARKKGIPVVWSQDWHPNDHNAFYASGKGNGLYDIIEMEGEDKEKYNQTMFPPHCIQGLHGAEIAMETRSDMIVQKGTNKYYDSYSAFKDDRARDTGLNGKFKGKYNNIITFGIGDCVRYTAKDAKEKNYQSFTIKELSPGRDDAIDDWDKEYEEQGLGVWHLAEVKQIVQAMPDKETIVKIEYKKLTKIKTPKEDELDPSKTVILVIDFQWDFMKGGNFGIEGADTKYHADITEFVNLARQKGIQVVWSQEWHPKDHTSFMTGSEEGKPEHCVQNTHGAKIAMETKTDIVVQLGKDKNVNSSSAVQDEVGEKTNLLEKLEGKKNFITFGLATNECVLKTARDVIASSSNLKSFTIRELCRGRFESGDKTTDATYDWDKFYHNQGLTVWQLEAVKEIVLAMPDRIPTPTKFTPPTKEILESPQTVIVVVDFQWDFMKGGPVGIEGADTTYYVGLVEKFVELARKKGIPVVWSQDWHPEKHVSFVTSHSDKKPGDTVDANHGKSSYKQKLWKEHCIQGSHGAKIAMETKNEIVVQKGTNKAVDSCSAFEDRGREKTGLDTKLKKKNYQNVITFGLGRDGGVLRTATDAKKYEFNSYTIIDLCRETQGEDATYDWDTNFAKEGLDVWKLKAVEKIVEAMPDKSNIETPFQDVPTGIGSFKLMNVGMVLAMVGAILLVVYVFGRDKLESIFFKCKQGGTSERDDQEDPDGLEGRHMVNSYEMTPLMHHSASDSHSNALGCSGGHAHVCSTP